MTLAYVADALVYDHGRDSYALRPDFDPRRHQVDIEFGTASGVVPAGGAGWNDPADPPIAHVRALDGAPIHAGYVCVAVRFRLAPPGAKEIRVDVLEIDHDVVGMVTEVPLTPGLRYPRASEERGICRIRDRVTEPCGFGPGTLIETLDGALPVEWLAPGDPIVTRDCGPQPLRWIGCTRVSARQLATQVALRPVRICGGQSGRSVLVASATRILLSGAGLRMRFGLDPALARAADLAEPDPDVPLVAGLSYYVLLFDRHQIVLANGVWCESLFAGARELLHVAAPKSRFPKDIRHDRTAYPCLRSKDAQTLGRRAPDRRASTAL